MHPFFVRNRLSAYIEGDLTDTEKEEIEAVLEEDDELRLELEELKLCQSLFHQLGQEEPSDDLFDRIMASVEEEESPRVIPWPKIIQYTSLAAAALLAVILLADESKQPYTGNQNIRPASVLSSQQPIPAEITLPIHEQPILKTNRKVTEQPTAKNIASSKSIASAKAAPIETKASAKQALPSSKKTKKHKKTSKKRIQRKGHVVTFVVEDPEDVKKIRRVRINAKSDSQILFKLQRLANRYSGKLLYGSGKSFQPFAMNEDNNFQFLLIRMPLNQLDQFKSGIRQLGGRIGQNYRIIQDQNIEIKFGITFNDPV